MTLRREAIAFLRGAASDLGGDLALALARAVLREAADAPAEWTRLALEIRDGSPSWAANAVTLAGAVLDDADGGQGREKAGGGQR